MSEDPKVVRIDLGEARIAPTAEEEIVVVGGYEALI